MKETLFKFGAVVILAAVVLYFWFAPADRLAPSGGSSSSPSSAEEAESTPVSSEEEWHWQHTFPGDFDSEQEGAMSAMDALEIAAPYALGSVYRLSWRRMEYPEGGYYYASPESASFYYCYGRTEYDGREYYCFELYEGVGGRNSGNFYRNGYLIHYVDTLTGEVLPIYDPQQEIRVMDAIRAAGPEIQKDLFGKELEE